MVQQIFSRKLSDELLKNPTRCKYDSLSPFGIVTQALAKNLHLRNPRLEDYRHNMDVTDQSRPEKVPTCGVQVWLDGYQKNLDQIVGFDVFYRLSSKDSTDGMVSIEVLSPYFKSGDLEEELAKIVREDESGLHDA